MEQQTQEKELKCKDKVKGSCNSRIAELKRLWAGYCKGDEELSQEFFDYGLSFDYVAPNTFSDQEEGYFRYQLSWGGPSSEFRFYVDYGSTVRSIYYYYLDWFDGAGVKLTGKKLELMKEIFNHFEATGAVRKAYEDAVE